MAFDPIAIEYAFDRLTQSDIGSRGTLHDADIFRHGTIDDLGKVIEEAADALKRRIESLQFTDDERENGAPEPRLRVEIDRLYQLSNDLKDKEDKAEIGYQWEVIGCLADSLAAVLEMLESRL